MGKIFDKLTSPVQKAAKREEEVLECDFDFMHERQVIQSEKSFIDKIDNVLTNAYAIVCGVFMIPDLLFMFISPIEDYGGYIGDVFMCKMIVFIFGIFGIRKHNNYMTIAAAVFAFLNMLGATDNTYTLGKTIARKLSSPNFEPNVIFFILILVISIIATIAIAKLKGVNTRDYSPELAMREDKEAYQRRLAEMDAQKAQIIEEQKKRMALDDDDRLSGDLGSGIREKKDYMDEI